MARLKTSPLWLDVTSSIVNGLSGSQRPAAEMLDMLEQIVALHPSQWLGVVSARPSWSEADLSYLLHAAVRLHAFQPPFLFLSLAWKRACPSKTSLVQKGSRFLRWLPFLSQVLLFKGLKIWSSKQVTRHWHLVTPAQLGVFACRVHTCKYTYIFCRYFAKCWGICAMRQVC